MAIKWAAIVHSETADVAQWQRDVDRLVDEERELKAQGVWVRGRDDFFGVLGIERKEIRHSAMIAWLLDPCAPHGLGVRFLAKVMGSAFGDEASSAYLPSAIARCEAMADLGRVDIVVEGPDLFLVIENKVDSLEGDEQCNSYYRHFRERTGAQFLFLTPKGVPPTSATQEAAKAFRSMSYRQLRQALAGALAETVPATPQRPGRHIAVDYLHTLTMEFK